MISAVSARFDVAHNLPSVLHCDGAGPQYCFDIWTFRDPMIADTSFSESDTLYIFMGGSLSGAVTKKQIALTVGVMGLLNDGEFMALVNSVGSSNNGQINSIRSGEDRDRLKDKENHTNHD
jgi:hypothetical protein